MERCENKTSGAAWAGLVIAIIALILVIVIWIFFFLEGDDLQNFEPVWKVESLDTSAKTIAGENFTLYIVPSNIAAGDTLILNKPDNIKAGQWFAITNLADKAVKVQAGSGVIFDSFPVTTSPVPAVVPPPFVASADLPGKMSWIVSWIDGTGTAVNLVPGGIKQS